MEDETGVANIIITPQLFDKYRLVLVDHPFLLISGTLQNQDNVVSVKQKLLRHFRLMWRRQLRMIFIEQSGGRIQAWQARLRDPG